MDTSVINKAHTASKPLAIAMGTAFVTTLAATAHRDNGWHALPETQLQVPWEWRTGLIEQAVIRKQRAREILQEYGDYDWLTGAGGFTVLKNGIEFAATYFIMLLVLFFSGAGRWFSLDYWIARRWRPAA